MIRDPQCQPSTSESKRLNHDCRAELPGILLHDSNDCSDAGVLGGTA